MSVVRGDPERLEAYSERTVARVAASRGPLADYEQALLAYNAADNDLGHGLGNRAPQAGGVLDRLRELDQQLAAFAWALRQLDSGFGLDSVVETGFVDLFEALAAARLQHPYAVDEVVVDQALAALADEYAAGLRELGMPSAFASEWDPALVERSEELGELFARIAMTAQREPVFADLLVSRLDADGVHEVFNVLRVGADAHMRVGDASGGDPFRAMLGQFAFTLQVAARDGGVSQEVLDRIVDAEPAEQLNLALLLAGPRSGWPRRFLEPAVRRVFVFYSDWRVSTLDPLAFGLFDGDPRQGALLRAGLHEHVAAATDPALLAAARERFDAIAREVSAQAEAGWWIFGRGAALTPGAREGLAWATLPHLDSIATDLDRANAHPLRSEWERTLAQLLSQEDAAAVLARGFGAYVGLQYQQGAVAAGQTQGGEADRARRFIVPAARVGELAALFIEAEGRAVGEEAAQWEFFLDAGEAAAQTAARLGIAATPVSGGTSIVAGGGASFAIGHLVDQIPEPGFDLPAAVRQQRDAFRIAAVRAVAADDTLAAELGIPPGDRALLADDEFIEAVLRGDEAQDARYEAILNRRPRLLETWAVDIRNLTLERAIGTAD